MKSSCPLYCNTGAGGIQGGNVRQLNVDPEFRDKIPPLSADEFSKLEENIVTDGEVREPLVV